MTAKADSSQIEGVQVLKLVNKQTFNVHKLCGMLKMAHTSRKE